VTDRLYTAIVAAEKATREAHDLAYSDRNQARFWTRISLGRAQSILMHYVVKHSATHMVVPSDPLSRTEKT
jgi:hypothetical protein